MTLTSSNWSAVTLIILTWRNSLSLATDSGSLICSATISSAWNTGFGSHPNGTRGLDQFIGEANMLDRGHGSAFIREFTERLFAQGTPRVVLDPNPANARAIRAYEKAGFHRSNIIDTPDGPALLMVRNP